MKISQESKIVIMGEIDRLKKHVVLVDRKLSVLNKEVKKLNGQKKSLAADIDKLQNDFDNA